MDIYSACEEAYKNGFEAGRTAGLKEILTKLKEIIEQEEHYVKE